MKCYNGNLDYYMGNNVFRIGLEPQKYTKGKEKTKGRYSLNILFPKKGARVPVQARSII